MAVSLGPGQSQTGVKMPTNKDRIAQVKRNARENDRHSGCSQGVLLALQEEFGIGSDEVFKAATEVPLVS